MLSDYSSVDVASPTSQAAKAAGIKPIIGAELVVEGRRHLAYVESVIGYCNLCFHDPSSRPVCSLNEERAYGCFRRMPS